MKQLTRGFVAVISAGVLAACSDSSTGPKANSTMSPQEALLIASGIMTEVSRAFSTSTAKKDISAGLSSVAPMPTETFSSNCANGGKIVGTTTFTDNLNSAGTGSFSGSMSVTPQGCMVSNGTRLIAVGGQWTFSYSMSFNQFAQAGDATWRGTGAFTWDGGSCALDYTMKLSPQGKGSITGTFCGVSLNQTI